MSAKRQVRGCGLRTTGTAEHGADPGDHLLEGERLGHVVVAAERQALDLVLGRVLGGEEQHRRADAVLPQPADDAEAVEAGHHHVEDEQVGPERLRGVDRLEPAGRGLDLEAGEPQRGRQQLDDARLVVDDEQAGFGSMWLVTVTTMVAYGAGWLSNGCEVAVRAASQQTSRQRRCRPPAGRPGSGCRSAPPPPRSARRARGRAPGPTSWWSSARRVSATHVGPGEVQRRHRAELVRPVGDRSRRPPTPPRSLTPRRCR